MASANCTVSMMGTLPLQNAMICCNALPMRYACTITHNTHTRAPQQAHTDYVCTLHVPYVLAYKCTLHALSFHSNSYSSTSLYPFCHLRDTPLDHTTSSAPPPPLNLSLPVSNITSVQCICMSDGQFSNYYQDCTLCITLKLHLLFNFFSQIFHAPPGPLFSIAQKI